MASLLKCQETGLLVLAGFHTWHGCWLWFFMKGHEIETLPLLFCLGMLPECFQGLLLLLQTSSTCSFWFVFELYRTSLVVIYVWTFNSHWVVEFTLIFCRVEGSIGSSSNIPHLWEFLSFRMPKSWERSELMMHIGIAPGMVLLER